MWRARRQETAPTCRLASVRRADGVAARYNYLPAELCCPACGRSGPHGKRAQGCSTRRRTDFSRDGRPRSPAGQLPRPSGPWRCRAAVPRRERARCVSRLWTPRPGAPVSPRPPGPRAVSQVLCGELPKSIIVPRASCTKASHLAIYVISDHIAALSAARLYFAPVLRSTTALIAPVHHNQ